MKKLMDVERALSIAGELVGLQNEVLSLELEMSENEIKFNQMIDGNYAFDTLIEIAENLHRINTEYMAVCDKLLTLKSEIEKFN